MQTHRYTQTQTQRHTDRDTQTDTDTQTETHRQTHTHACTHTHGRVHSHADTNTETDTDRHRDTDTQPDMHTHMQTQLATAKCAFVMCTKMLLSPFANHHLQFGKIGLFRVGLHTLAEATDWLITGVNGHVQMFQQI